MYDWPEVTGALDELWTCIARAASARGVVVPEHLSRPEHLSTLWRDPSMILGQVCSLNPVRDGLGETEVVGTIVYEPPSGLPQTDPGTYYSVLICRADDVRGEGDGWVLGDGIAGGAIGRFAGATVAANGTASQSGYWSLGHFVRDAVVDGPIFGTVLFTGAHRASVCAVADGTADIAAIDVHSWRLACEHESDATRRVRVVGVTGPTPGVVCVVSWELARYRAALDDALREAIGVFVASGSAPVLHVTGYRTRRLEEFQVVADRVDAASHRPWHR